MWGIGRFEPHQKNARAESDPVQVRVKLEPFSTTETVVVGDLTFARIKRTAANCRDSTAEVVFKGVANRRQITVPLLDFDWPRNRSRPNEMLAKPHLPTGSVEFVCQEPNVR